MKLFERANLSILFTLLISGLPVRPATAVAIIPTFGSSITSESNAAAIEMDVNYAIAEMSRLYTNDITVPITFQLQPLTGSDAAQSSTSYGAFSYSSYVSALSQDSRAHSDNTTLSTALTNLYRGNDANGSSAVMLTQTEAQMLGQYGLSSGYSWGSNTITLNSNEHWTFAGQLLPCPGQCQPITNSISLQPGTADANTAIFHEMDEILGGGGAGSTITDCLTSGGQFCSTYGPLDLYRYAASGVPSYGSSSTASAYMSFDGGQTDAIGNGFDFLTPLNDSADFNDAPNGCNSLSNLIQGYICPGILTETYSVLSPEFSMLSSIGWDHTPCTGRDCPVLRGQVQDPITGVAGSVPEPTTGWLFVGGISLLFLSKRYVRALLGTSS